MAHAIDGQRHRSFAIEEGRLVGLDEVLSDVRDVSEGQVPAILAAQKMDFCELRPDISPFVGAQQNLTPGRSNGATTNVPG